MAPHTCTIHDLFQAVYPRPFKPDTYQEQAILHTAGPLFLTAGPGSGKTRVLLWRTLNLLVFHDVQPEEIFLSTFTEKAAFQLQEGLRALLSVVTHLTGTPYDVSPMYIGTVHALCQRLLTDRRFSQGGRRPVTPVLYDALDQYFYVSAPRYWETATAMVGLSPNANETINTYFSGRVSASRHTAVRSCIDLFNRFSEECVDPTAIRKRTQDATLQQLIDFYAYYQRSLLHPTKGAPQTDFALLQQMAMARLEQSLLSTHLFKHVIIDEYQDTNTIQERLFFTLASGSKNLCVVGDDDQALYRFRGATVENFVQFPERCRRAWGMEATTIPLQMNYRSRKRIVEFYTDFITRHDWRRAIGGHYRIATKTIQAHNADAKPSVVATTPARPEEVATEVAHFVKAVIEQGKVEDPSQIAFLFPSLKSPHVERMKRALEAVGLLVYAPRAGRFLEVSEAVAIFGLFLQIFGKPAQQTFAGADYNDFHAWMDTCLQEAQRLMQADAHLAAYVAERRQEITTVLRDYRILHEIIKRHGWVGSQPYEIQPMKQVLFSAAGLSARTQQSLRHARFERMVQQRSQEGRPFTLAYILNRATSLDWSVLDLFYRFCGFAHFRQMFTQAETGVDEGPMCNLGLMTQYLARFIDTQAAVLTARFLEDGQFCNTFFMRFLYSLFRLGESEYEDAQDPFPRGRIPFLTIHQAKGLEFPIVVLANPRKDDRGLQPVERMVRPLLDREGEPEDRLAGFDIMRMFYVALSRAKHLLLLTHFTGQGQRLSEPFKTMLTTGTMPRLSAFDVATLPTAKLETDTLAKTYSYTSDYLLYQKCPRQYMIFRKYGFVASRSQTQVFGSLVHKTIEDLHHLLFAERQSA